METTSEEAIVPTKAPCVEKIPNKGSKVVITCRKLVRAGDVYALSNVHALQSLLHYAFALLKTTQK